MELIVQGSVSPAETLINGFLGGRPPSTRQAYAADLRMFADFCNQTVAAKTVAALLSRSQGTANALVHSYRASMLDCGLAPATINRRLATLRSLVRLARKFGMVGWTLDVDGVRHVAYRDTRGPGRAAVETMLEQTAGNGLKEQRDHAMIRLLFDMGLRRGEVIRLDVADVGTSTSTLSVLGKGRREKEELTMPEVTSRAVQTWLEASGLSNAGLFRSINRHGQMGSRLSGSGLYKMVRDRSRSIGELIRPHGIRHTAITEAFKMASRNGIPLEEVLHFSRHRSVATLMVYRDQEEDRQGELASLVASG